MKTRRYTGIIVATLLIIALILIFADPWSTFRADSRKIILKDPSQVDRISISDINDTVSLLSEDNRWMISGSEPANQAAVQNLLIAAEKLTINSIITEDVDWRGPGVKKVLFSKNKKVVLELDFMVRGDQYMVSTPGSERGFFVSISGYAGNNLDKVFSVSKDHYREHMLIELLPGEISLIEIELGNGKAYRFLQDRNDEVVYEALNDITIQPENAPEDLPVRLLFSYFTAIRYDRVTNIPAIDLTEGPQEEGELMARVHIESHQGEKHTLRIFPYYEEPGGDPHLFLALVAYDDYAEALLINYIYLDVLMRDPSHYFAVWE